MENEYVIGAEFYDCVEAYRTRADVGFFVDLARETGGPVLELGCGTGRVLIPTARAAIEIVGLDQSPQM
ncbi:MAG: class I SAM-dependent methyltransferase, partial [Deltaproteobacteria bacterium]